ncbi:prolyl oligopeptidase family serine peptidase [Phytomonospora endophytica]|uniref:prolyl oligopeptidase n=1 Tax=Phytomonospora endophytica TaxID=714109 RepID=A0A841FRK1_9ACTN|nr:prolyl oligopeptidase family serine peptidase [Phytomonospora endophytica]MBB6038855.1 prolyl oligopeptidase [Phytomonospora endophytica]GIG68350.1 prolyl endopeptidase [Phytomonospora endophytica]
MPSPAASGEAPFAHRDTTADMLHGVLVPDPYRWLEDRSSAATRSWSADQDLHWSAVRDRLPGLDRWRAAVAEHLDVDYASAPIWRGRTRFEMRHTRGGTRPGLYATGPDGPARNLLDLLPPHLAAAAELHAWRPSPDGDRLALNLAVGGSEQAALYIMDVASGRITDGPIEGCGHSSVAWFPCGRRLYYVRGGTDEAPRRGVYLHNVGADWRDDPQVYGGDQDRYYSVSVSPDGNWAAVSVTDGSAASGNELLLSDLRSAPPERPVPVQVQAPGTASSGITFGTDGLLYILTNREAPNRRIVVADPERPGHDGWRPLAGPDPGAVIVDFAIVGDHLLVSWSRSALSEVSLHRLGDGERLREVPLPGEGKVGPLLTRAGDGDRAWFSYTDVTTSPRVVTYRISTGLAESGTERPNRSQPTAVRTDRIRCVSADGTPIEMIMVRPRAAHGPISTILSGYGGFGTSRPPTYSAATMAWLRAGGGYVSASLRGGGEHGETWHAAGRRHGKQNVIDDLLACARHLIDEGWTSRERLAVWGGSNGALVAAAAVTQDPDLFAAAVCTAPLCDMVRYESSGLGPIWRSEYGTVADAEDFRHLLAYSPYHRVTDGRRYPATLFTVSEDDERVDPLHGRKMCAALQRASTGPGPVAIRRDRRVGHGNRALASTVAHTGDVLAFMAAHTGLLGLDEAASGGDDPGLEAAGRVEAVEEFPRAAAERAS